MKARLTSLLLFAAALHADTPKEILLWPNAAPGSEGKDTPEVVTTDAGGEVRVNNVNKPTLTPFLPAGGKGNGAAVIVAPGGGHSVLCMTHEGFNPAKWLADHGTAAFVLKYRLAKEPGSTYTVDDHAVADMSRAVRYVRSHAAEFGLRPNAIGVMGFSAGGEVCAIAAMRFDSGKADATDLLEKVSSRPDFQALIYPGRSQRIEPIKESPPAFLAASAKDREDISEGLLPVYLKFKRAAVPVELHLYSSGGHGFGLRDGKSAPVHAWIERLDEWMRDLNFTVVK
jgi:acetyl esterase/lipase